MISCEDNITPNCDTCYEVSFSSCSAVNIITSNLVSGVNYHLFAIDKFNKRYGITTTVKDNHSFDIDASMLPSGLFNAYAGKFEIFLSTTNTGEDYNVPLTISGKNYNCIIAEFTNTADDTICCENQTPCKTICELIDEVSAQSISDCLDNAEGNKKEDVRSLICTEKVLLKNSNDTYEAIIDPGTTVELQDTKVIQSDGSSQVVPYSLPVTCEAFINSLVKNSAGVLKYILSNGDVLLLPKHNVYKSDGVTAYGSDEFDENRIIPAVLIHDNGVDHNKDGGDTYSCTVVVATNVYKSNGSTLVINFPNGGSYSIPKHNIYKSNGSTIVRSDEFDVNFTIPKHNIKNSVGTIVESDEFDADYTTPNVKIFDSTGLVLKYTKEAGNNQSIPKYTIFQSDGVTIVTTKEFDTNYTTPPVLIKTSTGGTVYTKEAGTSQNIPTRTTFKHDGLAAYGTDEFNAANRTIPGVSVNYGGATTVYDGGDTVTIPRIYAWPSPTGQTTSYATRDDAWVQQNYFNALTTSGKLVTLLNFATLNENNSFGNTNRFTDSLGAQLYGSGNAAVANYVIDNFTGLGWFGTVQSAVAWATAISNAASSSQGGFSDWFVPNCNHITSISNLAVGITPNGITTLNYAPFNINLASQVEIYLSSTYANSTTFKWVFIRDGRLSQENSGSFAYLLCRKHF